MSQAAEHFVARVSPSRATCRSEWALQYRSAKQANPSFAQQLTRPRSLCRAGKAIIEAVELAASRSPLCRCDRKKRTQRFERGEAFQTSRMALARGRRYV